jgi:hypothetical protein
MRFGEPREALGEDASWTLWLRAGEAADRDLQSDSSAETGQAGEPAGVATMDGAGI